MITGPQEIEKAVEILRTGGVIAYPTETYYGLGADIENESALKKLFSLKKRSYDKPLLVLIDSEVQLTGLVSSIPDAYLPLIKHFWPGPLTLLFPVGESISRFLTGNTGTLGVRISSNVLTRELCRCWGKPLPATSANISGEKPARTAEEVWCQLGDGIDFVMRSDTAGGELASTIISIQNEKLKIIREGMIDVKSLQKVVGKSVFAAE